MFLLSAGKASGLPFVDVSFIERFGAGLQTFVLISHILHNAMCASLTRYCIYSLYLFHMCLHTGCTPPPSVGCGRIKVPSHWAHNDTVVLPCLRKCKESLVPCLTNYHKQAC